MGQATQLLGARLTCGDDAAEEALVIVEFSLRLGVVYLLTREEKGLIIDTKGRVRREGSRLGGHYRCIFRWADP